ncbi:MAG: type 4a pilus biogenesis protein PilO [Bdellovibrionales bacterium]
MKFIVNIANFDFVQIIVFGCLLMGVYWMLIFNDGSELNKQISDTENQVQQLEASVIKKQKEIKSLEDFKKEVSLKEKTVSYFLNYIPNELSSIDIFALLNKEAKVTGVNIEDKQDQASLTQEAYEILRIKLKVSGSFPQVVLFLSQLTKQKRILIVDNVSMRVAQDKRLIFADLDVFAFRYMAEKEKEIEEANKQKDKESKDKKDAA